MIVSDQTMTTETLRQLQLSEFYLLTEFKAFCKKHTLHFTLDFGSIIGAIRHQGFIPWDDDIDIAMLRWDYDAFLEYAKSWNHPNIFVQSFESDPEFVHAFTRIRLNGSLALQEEWKHMDVHHGIFIDVFPYDVIPSQKEERDRHQEKIYTLQQTKLHRVSYLRTNSFAGFIRTLVTHPQSLRSMQYLNRKQTAIMTRYNQGYTDSDSVTHMTQGFPKYTEYRRTIQEHNSATLFPFEGSYFPVPQNYEALLLNTYGDYLSYPPKAERTPHHGVVELIFRQDILEEMQRNQGKQSQDADATNHKNESAERAEESDRD